MNTFINPSRVIGAAEEKAAKEAGIEVSKDSYLDKVKKYIPGEIVVAYVFLRETVSSSIASEGNFWTENHLLALIFIICFIATPIYKWQQTSNSNLPKPIRQVTISTIAFIVWVFYFGDWLESLLGSVYYSSTLAVILVVAFTLLAPVIENFIPTKSKSTAP